MQAKNKTQKITQNQKFKTNLKDTKKPGIRGCQHCNYTSVEYLTDGVYGPCFRCSDWNTYDLNKAKRMEGV